MNATETMNNIVSNLLRPLKKASSIHTAGSPQLFLGCEPDGVVPPVVAEVQSSSAQSLGKNIGTTTEGSIGDDSVD
ncbi:hypothetical protein ACFX1Q_034602 [Malus domestica]